MKVTVKVMMMIVVMVMKLRIMSGLKYLLNVSKFKDLFQCGLL